MPIFVWLLPGCVAAAQDMKKPEQAITAMPDVSVFQRYSGLRQGSTQEVLIVLCRHSADQCSGCNLRDARNAGALMPQELRLEDSGALTVSYRQGKKYKRLSADHHVILSKDGKAIALKIHAPNKVDFRTIRLHGTVTYAVAGNTGAQGTLSFEIPLNIVSHDAQVSQIEWPYANHFGSHVVSALLLPLVPFEYLLLYIACHSGCDL